MVSTSGVLLTTSAREQPQTQFRSLRNSLKRVSSQQNNLTRIYDEADSKVIFSRLSLFIGYAGAAGSSEPSEVIAILDLTEYSLRLNWSPA